MHTPFIRYTLLADGSSDAVLIPIIDWVIACHCPGARILPSFAKDFGKIGADLKARAAAAIKNFPCDVLFVHRDAEAMPRAARVREIAGAVRDLDVPCVPVVPVRMTQAWLLRDETAIRFAAGNGSGRDPIPLPHRKKWEAVPDPKAVLFAALGAASGRTGRALRKFHPEKARALITQRTESFAALRGLPAFDAFDKDVAETLKRLVPNVMD
ncbi:hypothetical protein INH39_08545 [Massilia violaceinigra]|uniref:DUF4276 domain-containing protein n=1 Tax=Massilia violaceinigra TaxID=2045208 RepID=A0ABY4AA78_9BURK|nr:hypothetical protein [Massilia violaceinigra]UOD31713.1 hypothetical protein INH39_08545 [Massilia violaceinigra]